MMARVSEAIRRWTGWCPNARTFKISRVMDSRLPIHVPSELPPGPKSVSLSGKPDHYRHTQVGTIQIWATLAAVGVMVLSILFNGGIWITYVIIAFMLIALTLFGSLTVGVSNEWLQISFGPFGIIRKKIPTARIISAVPVVNPWYYGWGIRWTPDGPLYNISGEKGVMLTLSDGKRLRIGSDEPDALVLAITDAIG
jgi:hypothetical protein